MDIVAPLALDNQTVDATSEKDFAAPAGTRGFYISVRTAAIFCTWDGTTPSATNGLEIASGQHPVFFEIAKDFKAFGSAASCPTSVLWVK